MIKSTVWRSIATMLLVTVSIICIIHLVLAFKPDWAGMFGSHGLIALPMFLFYGILLYSSGLQGRFQKIIQVFACIVGVLIFLSKLYYNWKTGYTDGGTLFGGIVPFSDSTGYFTGMKMINYGEMLSGWVSRRPLQHMYLASIHFIVKGNIYLTLTILVAIVGFTAHLAATVLRYRTGFFPALLFFIGVYLYFNRFSGSFLSENLGITCGLISVAFTVEAIFRKRPRYAWLGIFFLTMGLQARPAAVFLSLTLPLAFVFIFRRRFRSFFRGTVYFFSSVAVVSLIGIIINKVMCVREDTLPFGNFALTLYGLVHNSDWTLAYRDIPSTTSEKELFIKAYRISFDRIKEHPAVLFAGMIKAWQQFFNGYIYSYYAAIKPSLAKLLFLGSTFAFLASLVFRKRPYAIICISIVTGTFLSVPFAPPWDADSMRVYAASVPYYLMLPLLLFRIIKLKRKYRVWERVYFIKFQLVRQGSQIFIAMQAAIGVVFLILSSFIILKTQRPPTTEIHPPHCPQSKVYIDLESKNSHAIKISQATKSWADKINIQDWQRESRAWEQTYPQMHKLLVDSKPEDQYHFRIVRIGAASWSFINVLTDAAQHQKQYCSDMKYIPNEAPFLDFRKQAKYRIKYEN